MADSSYVPTTRATDVWSFGMLCIEIFTDDVPFSHITNDMYIPVVIRDGSLPTRPERNSIARGLSDAMWDLMSQCWQRDPTLRPSITKIREAIQKIHPPRSRMLNILIYVYSS
jgi:son of sevenless-like protein